MTVIDGSTLGRTCFDHDVRARRAQRARRLDELALAEAQRLIRSRHALSATQRLPANRSARWAAGRARAFELPLAALSASPTSTIPGDAPDAPAASSEHLQATARACRRVQPRAPHAPRVRTRQAAQAPRTRVRPPSTRNRLRGARQARLGGRHASLATLPAVLVASVRVMDNRWRMLKSQTYTTGC